MNLFFIFILGMAVGAGAAWFFIRRKLKGVERELKRTEKEKEEVLRQAQDSAILGIADFNRRLREIKEERKRKILGELEKQGPPSPSLPAAGRATDGQSKIKTNGVADLLEVSRATAFRYLEELEQEGKIEQVGVTGRGVEYKLKPR